MGIGFLITLLASLGIGLIGTITQAATNSKSVKDTNEANLEAVRETNAANTQQAELAYQRSLPINQVSDMMQAGISKSAAIQKLTGGGTYQMPALQSGSSQAGQIDLSGLGEIAERIGNVPSNVQQHEMVQQQIDNLRMEQEMRKQALAMQSERHSIEMQEKMYGMDVARQTDELRATINQIAAEKGVDISSISNQQELIKRLGLDGVDAWKNAPAVSRDNALQMVMQNNQFRANSDAHNISVQTLYDLKEAAKDFAAGKHARNARYNADRILALLDACRESYNLAVSTKQAARIFEFDKDGNLVFENGMPKYKTKDQSDYGDQYSHIRGFWNGVFEVVPVNLAGDILRAAILRK